MRRLLPLTALLVTAAAAAAFAVLAPAAAPATRRIDTGYSSRALGGTLHFEVYLPAGYASSGERYPVVYFLHGLPAAAVSYQAVRFVERALDEVGQPAILVVPQGARAGETDPEYVDHRPGDNWADAISLELPRVVDSRYRTIANRNGRALVGVSAGGYGAMHLALRELDSFSVVESWSGYFHPTDPTGTVALSLGSPDRDAKADVHEQIAAEKKRLRSGRMFIAFYVGLGDSRFRTENEQLDRELTAAGIPHLFREFAGGHDQGLWKRHAAMWLGLAIAHLAAPR
jgi:enterochelin esterase-like enzyme